jgi:hypothetical protein
MRVKMGLGYAIIFENLTLETMRRISEGNFS